MLGYWLIAVVAALVIFASTIFSFRRRGNSKVPLLRARRRFRQQREMLEARFLTLNSQSGKPRGLLWSDCQFDDTFTMANRCSTNQFCALVGMTVRFEAIEGGEMEDNPNVQSLRAATAVFLYDGSQWATEGRVVFNLDPVETIRHFQGELELIESN